MQPALRLPFFLWSSIPDDALLDLTQDKHFKSMPFGTRGGSFVAHTFPLGDEHGFDNIAELL